jgi:Calcineurin-like phosphoesterase
MTRNPQLGRRPFGAILALLVLAAIGWNQSQTEDQWPAAARIVAIGDLHGDYDGFVQLLRDAKLVDSKLNWRGGNTHLVQTGDVLDRGDDSRKIIDLIMKLEPKARAAGGFIHPLIGNHESMNIYGDLRYVSPGEYASFRTPNSERMRDAFYAQEKQELESNPPPQGLPVFDDEYRAQWNNKHPLGWVEHRMGFGPSGSYGRWIRNNNAIVRVGDTLFMHAGLSPRYADRTIRSMNVQVRAELEDFSKLKNGIVMDPEGPLWYRDLVGDETDALKSHVEALLKYHGVQRIVVGHTVTDGAVLPHFGGKVIAIDVGISATYGSRRACLIVEKGHALALHRGQELELPGDSPAELLAYYRKAAALDPPPSPLNSHIRRLERQGSPEQ